MELFFSSVREGAPEGAVDLWAGAAAPSAQRVKGRGAPGAAPWRGWHAPCAAAHCDSPRGRRDPGSPCGGIRGRDRAPARRPRPRQQRTGAASLW